MKALSIMLLATLLMSCDAKVVDKPAQILALGAVNNGALLIDVRSIEEVKEGSLEQALHIPHDQIVAQLDALGVDKADPIVLFCRSGNRSGLAQAALLNAGFSAVINGGGNEDLKALRSTMTVEPPSQSDS